MKVKKFLNLLKNKEVKLKFVFQANCEGNILWYDMEFLLSEYRKGNVALGNYDYYTVTDIKVEDDCNILITAIPFTIKIGKLIF